MEASQLLERPVARPASDDIQRLLSHSFTCPDDASVAGISLASLFDAASGDDVAALASLRAKARDFRPEFDRLAGGIRSIALREYPAAMQECAQVEAPQWRTAASIFWSLAAAGSGDIRAGLAVANRTMDKALGLKAPAEQYMTERSLIIAGLRCLAEIERAYPVPAVRPDIPPPFFYLVSYPRSGSTMVRLFLSFVFRAPQYSVYPGDGRYFSRYFHDTADRHPVFVKDHDWREAYFDENVVAIVRDGRDAMLSYARYLYAEGHHCYVWADQLSEFLSFAAQRGFGFWGDHVRKILEARERGSRIRLVRYENLFRNYTALSTLARDLANGAPLPYDDEAGFAAHMAEVKKLFCASTSGRGTALGGWSENIVLPKDSYLPQDWSVGGGTLDWRRAFDASARRRFHELGGTEMLLKLGYETDPEWWRNG